MKQILSVFPPQDCTKSLSFVILNVATNWALDHSVRLQLKIFFSCLSSALKNTVHPQPQRPLEESYVNTLCWYFLTSATTPITATSCFWTWFVLISMYSVPLVCLTIESSHSSPMDTSCVFTSVMMVVLLVLPFLCTKLINLVDTSENLWLFN